jgi:hypothetical protein
VSDWRAAEQTSSRLTTQFPEFAAGWYTASRVALTRDNASDALVRIHGADIGRHYIAYHRLMDHWARAIPAVIHQINYESLVSDKSVDTRQLLEFFGLSWEDACVDFHRNPTATTTASAAQVRRKIYDT